MSEVKEQLVEVKKSSSSKNSGVKATSTNENLKKQLIYFGPSLKNLQQFQVFKGELPEHVKKYINVQPILQNLFIEPKELPIVQRNIGVKGTKEHQLYSLALSVTKGGIVNAL
ncbi:hypothetical protein MKY29_18360 [Psychrobacillus sp. FSL K6-2365]|uniref:hypothetical protein n=1 Tax=Psychrobacillus sp. FSL K6-2365 TaxID=2921546 RepID=UPI0030FB0510